MSSRIQQCRYEQTTLTQFVRRHVEQTKLDSYYARQCKHRLVIESSSDTDSEETPIAKMARHRQKRHCTESSGLHAESTVSLSNHQHDCTSDITRDPIHREPYRNPCHHPGAVFHSENPPSSNPEWLYAESKATAATNTTGLSFLDVYYSDLCQSHPVKDEYLPVPHPGNMSTDYWSTTTTSHESSAFHLWDEYSLKSVWPDPSYSSIGGDFDATLLDNLHPDTSTTNSWYGDGNTERTTAARGGSSSSSSSHDESWITTVTPEVSLGGTSTSSHSWMDTLHHHAPPTTLLVAPAYAHRDFSQQQQETYANNNPLLEEDSSDNDSEVLVISATEVQKPKELQTGLYALEEFQDMLEVQCCKNFGVDALHTIEGGALVRKANKVICTNDSTNQGKAQYGRLLSNACHVVFRDLLRLHRSDIFVDIGHGIGSIVFQAAYTFGCESHGIEIDNYRNFVASEFEQDLRHQSRVHKERDERYIRVGKVILKKGRLEVEDFRNFLVNPGKITKCFANNFNGVFGDRSDLKEKNHLDQYIAGLFCQMEPGSVMVTLHPLAMGRSLSVANELRKRHKAPPNRNASFFEVEKIDLGEARHVVSWSENGSNKNKILCYKYTRVYQPHGQSAVFMCCNGTCPNFRNRVLLPAVKTVVEDNGETRYVPNNCHCASGPTLRVRKSTR
jgi:hypothetical protein